MQITICMYYNILFSGRPGPHCAVYLHKHIYIGTSFFLGFAVTFSGSNLVQPLF